MGWARHTFQRSPHALPQLDGIRAIAIAMVLARHGVRAYQVEYEWPMEVAGWDISGPFLNGWAGVDLFFVLSGFLIAGSLMRSTAPGDALPDMRRYLLRRVLRIVPAYYAVLAIAVSGVVPYYRVPTEYLGLQVGYHLLFLQDYLPSGIVVAFWSLGVEEKFYLTAPLVWFALLRMRERRWRYAVVLAIPLVALVLRALTYASGPPTNYVTYFATLRSPFHLALDPLYIGVFGAMVFAERDHLPWTGRQSTVDLLFVVSAAGACLLLGTNELLEGTITWFDATLQPLLIAVAFGGVVLSVALGGGPTRLLGGRRLFVVSKLSYALYLVHLLVIPATIVWTSSWSRFETLPPSTHLVAFALCYLAASTVFALLIYLLVEHPFLVLKDRLSVRESSPEDPRRDQRPPRVAQTARAGGERTG